MGLLLNLSQAEKHDMFFDWQRQEVGIPDPTNDKTKNNYKPFIKKIHNNIDKQFHDTSSDELLKSSKIKAVKTIIEFVSKMTGQSRWMEHNPYWQTDTYGSEAIKSDKIKGTKLGSLIGLNMLLIDQ